MLEENILNDKNSFTLKDQDLQQEVVKCSKLFQFLGFLFVLAGFLGLIFGTGLVIETMNRYPNVSLIHFLDCFILTVVPLAGLLLGSNLFSSAKYTCNFNDHPTENTFYVFLRKIFNIIIPDDHYHTAKEVKNFLEKEGFIKIKSIYVPLYFPILKLFHITSWKKND